MRRLIQYSFIGFCFVFAGANCATPQASGATEDEVARSIAARLSRPAATGREPLLERTALLQFYTRRANRPAWNEPEAAAAVCALVRNAGSHGLRPEDYHAELLCGNGRSPDAEASAQHELMLSDAFLHLGRHLANGSLDPRSLHRGYERGDTPPDPVVALEDGLRSGRPAAALEALAPPHPQYALLREQLTRLREEPFATACPGLPDGPLVRPGDRDPRVLQLRDCLRGDDDASGTAAERSDPARLDPALAERLRSFQRSQRLVVDGILGPATTAALTATAEHRIELLRANLERWRWQPRDFGRRMLRVDIPQYRLRGFDGPQQSLEMRVVVGCSGWRTPLLHSAIDALVLNPAWNVPRSILVKEMIPRARRDASYFARHDLQLSEGTGKRRHRVDPRSIDWSRVDTTRTTLRARQPAGPRNPLGRAKFLFSNAYGVYLHGTPGRSAFDCEVRSLSHGCVRVEDELALALFALAPDANWNAGRLDTALQQGPGKRVPLPEPLPLHLLYFTAEVAADGSLELAADPYGWDALVIDALGSFRIEP